MPRMITIKYVKPSQSGKSLSITDQDGNYYQSKKWELGDMQGQAINATVSTSEYNGKSYMWINEWEPVGGQGQPAHQMDAPAPQTASAPRSAEPAQVDREASITAQALCKCLSFDSPDSVFRAYAKLYNLHRTWSQAGCPSSGQSDQQTVTDHLVDKPPAPEFDDDIPF